MLCKILSSLPKIEKFNHFTKMGVQIKLVSSQDEAITHNIHLKFSCTANILLDDYDVFIFHNLSVSHYLSFKLPLCVFLKYFSGRKIT